MCAAIRLMLEQRKVLLGVALLIVALSVVTNLPWHLDNYDQAKQAFVSFEMVEQGHWFYQQTPREKVATKPPLVGWISAACYEVTRSWEIAWRLPSFVAALALAFALMRAVSGFGFAASVIALSAFGLNMFSPRLATLVRTDMPLALVVFLLGWKILEKIRAATPWGKHDRMVMFGLLTAAMLIKGPIVYAFLLPGVVAFQFWRRDKSISAWCGWWPWLISLAIFGVWVAGGIASVPGFYEQVVLKEFAGRFDETVHRPQPFYFYLPYLLQKLAPWSLLSLGLGIIAWRSREKFSPDVFWLVVWSLGGLVVLSLVPSKRIDRIFPIVPPLCLLIAIQASRARRWASISLIVAVALTSAYAAQRIFDAYRHDDGALARFGAEVRLEAATNGWRYEVISAKEEGLLLYLRRTRFVRPNEAIARWKAGDLDAVVTPAEESARLLREMNGSVASGLEAAIKINGDERRYLLLRRANTFSTSPMFDATVPSS